ncbi:AAA family ATPase [Acinetobacter baumannii]|uniref:AAA family ATPase n=1 Tax=Acinetobacter baumannii TaxID=470 RepID=UPI0029298E71|nr:AAA family ATPase [Acinetobacter baumannii]ELT0788291.1 AAA family ATPase [Acinetobacter baumannii]
MNKDSTRYLVGNAKNGHIPSIFTLSKAGDKKLQNEYFNEIVEILDNTTDYRVYLNEVSIFNYRKINDLNIDFHNRLTVFIGENGVGKTSILSGIFKNLTVIINNILKEDVNGLLLIDSDINNRVRLNREVGIEDYCEFSCNLKYGSGSRIEGALVAKLKGSTSKKRNKYDDYKLYGSIWREVNGLREINLPLFSFYGINRLTLDKKKAYDKNFKFIDKFDSYSKNLNSSSSFNDFVQWLIKNFKQRNGYENNNNLYKQIMLLKEIPLEKDDPLFNLLIEKEKEYNNFVSQSQNRGSPNFNINIIENIFKKIYKDFIKIELDMSSGKDEIFLEFQSDKVNINQLSDGQRVYLGLLADIAYKMILLNPKLPDPLKGHGIILIDEIELHLHPKWQQQSIILLQEIFPNIQFIITTHSPHVLSTVDKSSIRILTENGLQTVPYQTKGIMSSDVLELIMGTKAIPNIEEANKLENIYELLSINEFNIDEINELLFPLINHFGENHPEIDKIKSLIKFRELKIKLKDRIEKK